MVITEITSEGKLYGQNVADGSALEKISQSLQRAFTSNPPVIGSYQPRRGGLRGGGLVL